MEKKQLNFRLVIMTLVFSFFSPILLSAQNVEPIVIMALIQSSQNVDTLHVFDVDNDQDAPEYLVFYGQSSGNAYFVRREDITSSNNLVHQFGRSFDSTSAGITTFLLDFNRISGLEMMAEENLEPIGIMVWARLQPTNRTDNTFSHNVYGFIRPRDARAKQIFELLVIGGATRIR
ncbi:MAG: hypothetical protein FWG89_08590 [Treponema sp.]|nr:hypothetical protein [Treponema sp.]